MVVVGDVVEVCTVVGWIEASLWKRDHRAQTVIRPAALAFCVCGGRGGAPPLAVAHARPPPPASRPPTLRPRRAPGAPRWRARSRRGAASTGRFPAGRPGGHGCSRLGGAASSRRRARRRRAGGWNAPRARGRRGRSRLRHGRRRGPGQAGTSRSKPERRGPEGWGGKAGKRKKRTLVASCDCAVRAGDGADAPPHRGGVSTRLPPLLRAPNVEKKVGEKTRRHAALCPTRRGSAGRVEAHPLSAQSRSRRVSGQEPPFPFRGRAPHRLGWTCTRSAPARLLALGGRLNSPHRPTTAPTDNAPTTHQHQHVHLVDRVPTRAGFPNPPRPPP